MIVVESLATHSVVSAAKKITIMKASDVCFEGRSRRGCGKGNLPGLGVCEALAPPRAAKLLSIACQVALSLYTDRNRGYFTSEQKRSHQDLREH